MPKLSWLKGRVMAKLLLLLIPFTIVSCKDDLELDWKVSNKDNVMIVQAPNDHYNPYVNITSNDYNVSNRYSKCTFSEKTTYLYVYAKQDGKIVDCGQCSADLDSDRKKLTLKYNEKGLIKTTNEHTVYFSQTALTIKDNVPYIKSELNRTGSFYTVGKASLKSSGATVQGKENGVNEIVYIVNRTNSPIKFKHKGFSADELWYYNSAEISLDNMQTVVNGEAVKSDVESEVIEVPLLSDKKMSVIYSHYPPNGKKIKNATLIAEIDGKEVRTSNTLSSNLDIVSGNAYLYVLEWDGKELKFAEDENGEPVVHVVNGENGSELKIEDYTEDGKVVVSSSDNKQIPKVNEIIASGITPETPYGMLRKVTAVHQIGSGNDAKWELETRQAFLDEAIKECHISCPLDVSEDGTLHAKQQTRGDVGVDVFDISFKTPITFGGDLSIKAEPSIGLKGSLNFILDITDHKLDRIGITGQMNFDAKVKTTLSYKAKAKSLAVDEIIQTTPSVFGTVIMVGIIPVYINLQGAVIAKGGVSGECHLSWTPISGTSSSQFTYIYNRVPDPLTGKHIEASASSMSFTPLSKIFDKADDVQLGFSGTCDMGLAFCGLLGIYSKEVAYIAFGPRPYMKISGGLELNYNVTDDYYSITKDELTPNVGVDLYGSMELFKIVEDIGLEKIEEAQKDYLKFEFSPDITMFDIPLGVGMSLFPHTYDMEAKPKDATSFDFSCYRSNFIYSFPFTDWGIAYGIEGTPRKLWKHVSLTDKETVVGASSRVKIVIEDKALNPTSKYIVDQYAVVPFYNKKLYKKGTSFSTSGKDFHTDQFIIIPGYDL